MSFFEINLILHITGFFTQFMEFVQEWTDFIGDFVHFYRIEFVQSKCKSYLMLSMLFITRRCERTSGVHFFKFGADLLSDEIKTLFYLFK